MNNIRKTKIIVLILIVLSLVSGCSNTKDQRSTLENKSKGEEIAETATAKSLKNQQLQDSVLIQKLELTRNQLKHNAQNRYGRKLLEHLSEESVEWLESMIDAIRYDDSTQVEGRPYFEQLTILGLRHAVLAGYLKSSESRKVAAYLFAHGPLKTAFELEDVGPINLSEDRLEASYGLLKAPKVPVYIFKLEGKNEWKLDLVKMLPVIARAHQTIALKKNMSYTESIIYLLEVATSQNFSPKIFEPLDF